MPHQWPASEKEHERARRVIPGGVNSPARAFGAVGGHPIVIDRGDGPYLFDIEGNRYLDYIGSWGPMILGHCEPEVQGAVQKALCKGMTFGAPAVLETEMAELLVEAVPSLDQVRMVSSGTEAAMSAIRVARGFTGRNLVVKFAGCYHGHVDCLLVKAGSGAMTHGTPSSPGVPAGCTQDTVVLAYNDLAEVRAAFEKEGGRIAAVMLEPAVGNMGLVPPTPGFLQGLRELTERHGALLIFDEVMTGFRLSWGGAQQLFGVTPDMTVLGKIIGGGMPVGAYGGRADVMQAVSPTGPVYQAGTLSGNPVAMAAGLTTLQILRRDKPYARLDELSALLAAGLNEAAESAGVPHCVQRVGSMLTLFFHPGPISDYESAAACDTKLFAKFFWKMMERGMYWPCSQFEALFVSAAHTRAQIEETIIAARESLQEIAEQGPRDRET